MRLAFAFALATSLAACAHANEDHATKPGPAPALGPQLESNLQIASEDLEFAADGRMIPATFVHPTTGVRPAVVLMAGSGPTDRDWNSPLIEGQNGSGKLIAEALARHGFSVLRFDKAVTGKNKLALDKLVFDTYVAEGRGALAWLRAQKSVDAKHLFVAGHSEGGIHATRVALAEGRAIHGLLLLSAAGRPMFDIIVAQVSDGYRAAAKAGKVDAAVAEQEIASFKQAIAEIVAGRPVDPQKVSMNPNIQMLVANLALPQTAQLVRPMSSFDPAVALKDVTVPVFVYNGMRDIQVDPELDAKRLAGAKAQGITLYLGAEANHVLKHETRSLDELRADRGSAAASYNAPDAQLDGPTIDAIVGWLAHAAFAR